jgi:hypothetical protein
VWSEVGREQEAAIVHRIGLIGIGNMPVTGIVHEAFKHAHVSGEPDWTQPGIVTYWRRLNEV